MKYIALKVACLCIAVALPQFVAASDDPDVLPADAALLSDEHDSVSHGGDALASDVSSLQGSATGASGAGASASAPAVAAAEVLFAQFERSAARYDFENARVHAGFMFTEERDTLFQAGLSLDASFVSSFRLSFGTRVYAALLSDENNDVFAGAIGGELAYHLPFEKLPLELSTSLYYAPDVFTFGQGDRVIDWQIDVTLPFRSQLSVFTGIRFLQVDTRPGDREIDNRLHIGIRWDFI